MAGRDRSWRQNLRPGWARVEPVRDRDQRHVGKTFVEVFQIRQILSAVQGSDGPSRLLVENRKMELVDVEMHDIEFGGHPTNFVEHQHVIGDDIAQRQGSFAMVARNKARALPL